MRSNSTELVFILDRGGSMAGLKSDTIGGFNYNLKKQQKVEGVANVTTVLFDDRYELLHNRQPIREVRPLTSEDYQARGTTALLDAMGKTIEKMIQVQKKTKPEHKADKVLFVIITDGYENASREYTGRSVQEMVRRQQEKYGWEFIFLGANIDSIATASMLGFRSDRIADFHPDAKGMQINYEEIEKVVDSYRKSGRINENWNCHISEDFRNRSGRK